MADKAAFQVIVLVSPLFLTQLLPLGLRIGKHDLWQKLSYPYEIKWFLKFFFVPFPR
jgi:hypothetical protein